MSSSSSHFSDRSFNKSSSVLSAIKLKNLFFRGLFPPQLITSFSSVPDIKQNKVDEKYKIFLIHNFSLLADEVFPSAMGKYAIRFLSP